MNELEWIARGEDEQAYNAAWQQWEEERMQVKVVTTHDIDIISTEEDEL